MVLVLLNDEICTLSVLNPINVIAIPKLTSVMASLNALTCFTGISIFKLGKTIITITALARKIERRSFLALFKLTPFFSTIPSIMNSNKSDNIKNKAAIETYNNHFPVAFIIGVSLNADKTIKPIPAAFVNVEVKYVSPFNSLILAIANNVYISGASKIPVKAVSKKFRENFLYYFIVNSRIVI
ncbi:hypothetical protein DOT_0660 [Desulfosporosinus sp. OT]|nr:hypothetical protein DOT_0660 [Desulfosporosinus sp. OT]